MLREAGTFPAIYTGTFGGQIPAGTGRWVAELALLTELANPLMTDRAWENC
jgi:hypothetical protein